MNKSNNKQAADRVYMWVSGESDSGFRGSSEKKQAAAVMTLTAQNCHWSFLNKKKATAI